MPCLFDFGLSLVDRIRWLRSSISLMILLSCFSGAVTSQGSIKKDHDVRDFGKENSSFVEIGQKITAPQVGNWINNQNASVVIGQPDFTTNSPGSTLNKFSDPFGVTVDPVSGKVFVVETVNNRVLRFSSSEALVNGGTAEASFGGAGATAANTMVQPRDVTMDSNGNLWVADQGNNRVLRFSGAANLASGSPADRVLGQSDLFGNAGPSPPTQTSLRLPSGVFADAGGRLWVTDYGNHRVLRFDGIATLSSGSVANGVLGKPDFVTNSPTTTQTGMRFPYGVTADLAGRLWVADLQNNRVLRFDSAATLSNGANASGVLGQTGFNSGAAASPATIRSMNNPSGVSVDQTGTLYVSDGSNNRVQIYDNASTKANGADADNVFGQPGFITSTPNNGGISPSSISTPVHLFFDEASQNLFVPDAGNNRVLRFARVVTTAAGVSVSGRVLIPNGRGLINTSVILMDMSGQTRRAWTGKGGYYRFDDVPIGETYLVSVASRRFYYDTQIINVFDNLTDVDFMPAKVDLIIKYPRLDW